MAHIITLILALPVLFFFVVISFIMIRESIHDAKLRKSDFGPYEKNRLERELKEAQEKSELIQKQCNASIEKIKEECAKSIEREKAQYKILETESNTYQSSIDEKIKSLEKERNNLSNKVKDLTAERDDFREENKYLSLEISRYIKNNNITSATHFNLDTQLYQNGVKDGCLVRALSEDISKRIVNPNKINDIISIHDTIEILSESSREKFHQTSLSKCTCEDFWLNHSPKAACKHMFTLAIHLDLITIGGKPIKPPQKKK